ncbi:undecaprenyl-phosphate 4-deoxy-4-formamido-L-arabinose transferase [Propionibacterium cyclohexanicum]|uniref:Undecaprenyl-phosphate 4-deoxy-4-formamido-L-arabinose transferase n=1 Tax=Propionibacterium cyclohexanicum TaxID=64702 RepID=A0A1H9RNU9_9ACTN|nr:glycosyltransferase [Propionibacterium cyclohexanicum]SER74510.1 undecaprenyl-phosphate 4-deoxy-4-formamido-L-arabinose transferase [Propionibacterium cyclohexanicum]
MPDSQTHDDPQIVHSVSVVIPVYKGEDTLPGLISEIAPFTERSVTPDGHHYKVDLVYPVWDNGPDHSDDTIRQLADQWEFIHPVWLSRNYGQHPATIAGMASTSSDWIVTMDEDGQHDPSDIAKLLDTALREKATLVYAKPLNPPPHGAFRNWASGAAKRFLSRVMGTARATDFNSFRLVLGETGRALAAYAGPGVYLDVALGWITKKTVTCPVTLRQESRPSGYRLKTLISHFLRMVVTSGTRGLRLVTLTGLLFGAVGILLTISLIITALISPAPVQGWTSLMCVSLIGTGVILASMGIVAEYIGVCVNTAMGKPLYLITSDPGDGPLGLDDMTSQLKKS